VFKPFAKTVILFTLITLLSACGAPTATIVPPPPMAVSPTAVPPTAVSPTVVPPTAEPLLASDTWIKTYGGDRDVDARGLLLADDGGYFVEATTEARLSPGPVTETC